MENLTVEDLGFDYDTRPVLRHIDFSVKPGTICGLLGPNGSGKSTLFKCINGLLKTKQGRVMIGEKCIARLSRTAIAGIMAVVPQQTTVAFAFSALQMVLMGRASRLGAMGRPSPGDVRDAASVLGDLGIAHLKNRPFNALSGGERQIVLMARAIFQAPSILLLDEPTAHLDFKNQYLIMDLVQDLTRRHHLTTLVTLHDPNLAGQYCSQLLVMLKRRADTVQGEHRGCLRGIGHRGPVRHEGLHPKWQSREMVRHAGDGSGHYKVIPKDDLTRFNDGPAPPSVRALHIQKEIE